jgi:hypothetical protein
MAAETPEREQDDLTPAGKPKPAVGAATSGDAFAVLGRVSTALRATGHTPEEINRYAQEAIAGDDDHLLRVSLRWAAFDFDLG